MKNDTKPAMHDAESAPHHLLLFRGTDWHKELSPEEIQRIMADWSAWVQRLAEAGKFVGGNPLENEGRVLSAKHGGPISDGPFTESKEAVGGYFLLRVDTLEEALAIGRECPALPHGLKVEVRPVAPACPVQRMSAEAAAHAMS